MFTDLVGSTALSSQVGPTAAERLRQEHFAVLRAAIADASGREVKNVGDGLMVAFDSAAAAVDCAVGMQQRLEQRNRRSDQLLSVRIGMALGDADLEGEDYFGPPVVEAARLCDKAQGGQILCGEMVRMMAGGRGEHRFDGVGELELKGLPEPVTAFEVGWEPLGLAATIPSAATAARIAAYRLCRPASRAGAVEGFVRAGRGGELPVGVALRRAGDRQDAACDVGRARGAR